MKFRPNNYLLAFFLILTFTFGIAKGADGDTPDNRWYTKFDYGVASIQSIRPKSFSTFSPGPSNPPRIKSDAAMRGDIALGYELSKYFATEARVGYQETDLLYWKSKLTQIPFLMDGIIRYPNRTRFEPFIGMGVGAVRTSLTFHKPEKRFDGVAFACEPMIGCSYRMSSQIHFGVNYRYLLMDDFHLKGNNDDRELMFDAVGTHVFALELGIHF